MPEFELLQQISVVVQVGSLDRSGIEAVLDHLNRLGPCWTEVILCFDATQEQEVSWSARYPFVRCVDHAESTGRGGAHPANGALFSARGDWVLCLPAGTVPDLETWQGLCRLLNNDPEVDCISLPILDTPLEQIRGHRRASLFESAHLGHSGLLCRARAIRAVGGWDSDLSHEGAMMHWAARAMIHGCHLMHCPEAKLTHCSAVVGPPNAAAYNTCLGVVLLILRHAPAKAWRRLLCSQIRYVISYSIIHRTGAYLRALWCARRLWHAHPEQVTRLDEDTFGLLKPDWHLPYTFLD